MFRTLNRVSFVCPSVHLRAREARDVSICAANVDMLFRASGVAAPWLRVALRPRLS